MKNGDFPVRYVKLPEGKSEVLDDDEQIRETGWCFWRRRRRMGVLRWDEAQLPCITKVQKLDLRGSSDEIQGVSTVQEMGIWFLNP